MLFCGKFEHKNMENASYFGSLFFIESFDPETKASNNHIYDPYFYFHLTSFPSKTKQNFSFSSENQKKNKMRENTINLGIFPIFIFDETFLLKTI